MLLPHAAHPQVDDFQEQRLTLKVYYDDYGFNDACVWVGSLGFSRVTGQLVVLVDGEEQVQDVWEQEEFIKVGGQGWRPRWVCPCVCGGRAGVGEDFMKGCEG